VPISLDEQCNAALEEWRIIQQGRGWTVSALCPVRSCWALAPLLGASAASFVPLEAVTVARRSKVRAAGSRR